MEDRAYQGAFPETLEKARALFAELIERPYGVTFDKLKGERFDKNGLVVGLEPDSLDIRSHTKDDAVTRFARWMDALPMNVRLIHAERDHNRFTLTAVVYHDSLWAAEVEAASRGNTAIWMVP